ncbi:MAG: hypothetical protein KJ561_01945, partial [Nanoarchaeota archaeon]|nr:hypothetical protein [Nanoarchaeota archaeon]
MVNIFKKEGSLYTNKFLLSSVLVLIVAMLAIFVIGQIDVTLTNPVDGTNYSSRTVVLNCSVLFVGDTNTSNITLWTNVSGTWAPNVSTPLGNTTTLNNTNFSLTLVAPSDGFFAWNCMACNDSNGNCTIAASNLTIMIDTTGPTFSGNADNSTVNLKYGGSVQLNVTINDSLVGLYSYILAHNDTGSWVNTTLKNISGSPVIHQIIENITIATLTRGGVLGWKVYANDTLNNIAVSSIYTLTVNNTAPTTPTIIYPVNGSNYSTIPYIQYSSGDVDGDTITYSVYINNSLNASTIVNLSLWSASDGYYNITVSANDSDEGTVNSTTVYFNLDSVAPTINSITLSDHLISKAITRINVTVNATDTFTGVNTVTVNGVALHQDSSEGDTWSTITNISVSPLNVSISDSSGNTATNNTVTVTYDNTAPTTTFNILEADGGTSTIDTTGATWYKEDINVTLTAIDAGGVNVSAIWYRNGTNGTWAKWTQNMTFGYSLTSNTFQFMSNDTLGNYEGYTSKYINIDTATPNVTISSLSSNVTGTAGRIAIAVTATASISGLDTTKIQAWHNGPTGSTNSSKVNLSLSSGKYVGTLTAPTAAGFYLITVNVSDMAGNYNSSVQKTFSVDSSIPTI